LIDLKSDGSFRLDQTYFDYMTGFTMTNRSFAELFGEKVRDPGDRLTTFHMDIAASIQAVTEEIVLRLNAFARSRNRRTKSLSRRGRRSQLRCQRQGAARQALQANLGATRGGGCGRRSGGGDGRLSPGVRPSARDDQ
jgi:hypothetical protein